MSQPRTHKQMREERARRQAQQNGTTPAINMQQTLNPGCSMMVNNAGEERLLLRHLQPHFRVLEFGSGLSTNIIAKRVRELVSIEHNINAYNQLSGNVAGNVTLLYVPANREPSPAYDDGTFEDFHNYVLAPAAEAMKEKFDIVFIDGRSRVACAEYAAKSYLKPGGLIFIHDYKHPQPPPYRRLEYEVVENFLDLQKHVFAMACFTVKGQTSSYLVEEKPQDNIADLPEIGAETSQARLLINKEEQEWMDAPMGSIQQTATDKTTCWHTGQKVVDEMNKFFDQHRNDPQVLKHLQTFTELLSIVSPEEYPRLLDLGCGTAMLSEYCQGFEYTGADLPPVISGCAMRNFPNYSYRACNIEEQDLAWIKSYDVVVLNAIIDIMQQPLEALSKVLTASKKYVIIHRQEITEAGQTHIIKNDSYGGETFHSIISRADFEKTLADCGMTVVCEAHCSFGNWENGGNSFLLTK